MCSLLQCDSLEPSTGLTRRLRYSAHLVTSVFALLALAGIALPTIGMALDHHFAERDPAHAHIYFGGQAITHIHHPNAAHGHNLDISREHGPSLAESGPMAVLDQDRSLAPALTLNIAIDDSGSLAAFAGPDGMFLPAAANEARTLVGITTAPPELPPLA